MGLVADGRRKYFCNVENERFSGFLFVFVFVFVLFLFGCDGDCREASTRRERYVSMMLVAE